MEAASVAWHPLGWTPVGFSEIEPFPCAILKHRFPNIPNYGSLTEYQSWPIEPGAIDLLVGGCPCQSFSVAGLRRGMQDPRGNLTLTYLGLVDKLKPRWVVYENVPGLLSSNGGRDFGSFVGALGQLGYGWAMRILDAQHFGVPQRRRRVFVVACLGDWRAAAEVLSLREGLRGYLETGNKKRKGPAADAGASVEAGGLIGGLDYEMNPHGPNDVTGPLLKGSPTGGGRPLPAIAFRKSKRACSTTDNETWVPADASNTLNNFDLGDTRTTHAVVQPIAIQSTIIGRSETAGPDGPGFKVGGPMFTLTKQGGQNGVCHQMPGSVAPTIGASGPPYSRTGNERVEAEALAVTFQPGNLRREAGADPSFTTTTTTLKASAGDQTPHVACFKSGQGAQSRSIGWSESVSPTLPSNAGGNTAPAVIGLNPPMAVRRLTPVECERLQGFPDNWSRISWKGKPEEECPDGPRYKACGNSMAVPVMRWIGERIAAVDATLSPHA